MYMNSEHCVYFYVSFLVVDGVDFIFCNIKVAFLGLKHLIFYFYAIKFAQQVLAYNIKWWVQWPSTCAPRVQFLNWTLCH